jgi:hypothetical protein
MAKLSDFEKGLLLGVLIGEGHFGGDGKQPQVTIKMHVRHERLMRWLYNRVPHSRLYGPYNHGGRHYFQLMFRGEGLKSVLAPLLCGLPWPEIDDHSHSRFVQMLKNYGVPPDVLHPAPVGQASAAEVGSS